MVARSCSRDFGKVGKPPQREDWIRTCTIITGEPNDLIREIHTRMQVILPEDKLDAWLSGEAGKEIPVPYPADRMTVWPISSLVNSPKNRFRRTCKHRDRFGVDD
jgi:putative SOS response-associated peptidase YedK